MDDERTTISFGKCDHPDATTFFGPSYDFVQCEEVCVELNWLREPTLARTASINREGLGGGVFQGQVLLSGEPTCAQDAEMGEWVTTYPFLFVPVPATDAYSFGGPSDYVPFVQEVA